MATHTASLGLLPSFNDPEWKYCRPLPKAGTTLRNKVLGLEKQ